MSLRAKLAVALAALAGIAAVGIGAASFRSTSTLLRGEINDSLARGAAYVEFEWREHGYLGPFNGLTTRDPASVGLPRQRDDGYGRRGQGSPSREFDGLLLQVLDSDGNVILAPLSGPLPVDETDRSAGQLGSASEWIIRDIERGHDDRLRMVTIPVEGGAVQLARSLHEVDEVLSHLVKRTILTVVLVAALAALIGWWFARRLTQRLVALTSAAEQVSITGDLGVPIPSGGTDESGRLGTAIDQMLGSLAASRDAQQRLVQDAGHELRTPLTSLRTNISVLRRNIDLPIDQRIQVLGDLDSESRELTTLVNELLDAAADRSGDAPSERISLALALPKVVTRGERRTGRKFALTIDDSVIELPPGAIDRVVGNLLDNAAKFDDSTIPIEVDGRGGAISVRDHGDGFTPEDLDHVFERFYRATSARSRPGSGLGLAIVRDITVRYGGTVTAANHPDGGAIVTVQFPPA